ncbi:MAG: cupin domain-containing protein [Rubripirellula sp.]
MTNRSTPSIAAVVDLSSLPPVPCPCGTARRAFADREEFPGTVHLTHISKDARQHYHLEHTEVYVILECGEDAVIELDGQSHPVRPHTSILIPPGVRHRACGEMTVLIMSTPNFDPADEHFD